MKQETGKCNQCGKDTPDRHLFLDDPDDWGYYEWCCDECYAKLTDD